MQLSEIDNIVATLPAGWNVWQTFDGRVCLQLRCEDLVENLDGSTLSEVLVKASNYKVLRKIRRRPELFLAADHEPCKTPHGWCAVHRATGRNLGYHLKTRKAVLDSLAKWEEASRASIAKYDAIFAEMFPNGAQEGVDFRYEGRWSDG